MQNLSYSHFYHLKFTLERRQQYGKLLFSNLFCNYYLHGNAACSSAWKWNINFDSYKAIEKLNNNFDLLLSKNYEKYPMLKHGASKGYGIYYGQQLNSFMDEESRFSSGILSEVIKIADARMYEEKSNSNWILDFAMWKREQKFLLPFNLGTVLFCKKKLKPAQVINIYFLKFMRRSEAT